MTKKTTPHKSKAKGSDIKAALVKKIIHRIEGGETLTAICREDGMPPESSVRRRIKQSSVLLALYARAQEERTKRWAEEIVDIAEDGSNDWMERETRNGTIVVLNNEAVRRSELRIDTRKWLLARLMPRQFGDKVEHGGSVAVQHTHDLSPTMLANLDALRARLPSLPVLVEGERVDKPQAPDMETIKARVKQLTTRSDPASS